MKQALSIVAVAVVVGGLSVPRSADACLNELMLTQDDMVKRIAQIEFHLRYEQYWLADQALPPVIEYIDGGEQPALPIKQRMQDAEALIKIRWHREVRRDDYRAYRRGADQAALWFYQRVWDEPTSPKLRAWLAEASEASEQPARALGILRDLDKRDLMPDAFAYATLAAVSYGEEWVAAREKCERRAEVKSICAIRVAY
jgi:hypothetical protein